MKSSDAQASAMPLGGFRGWWAELESPAFLWSFLYFFLLLTAYYVLRPVRDALGSTQNLQWLFSGTFVVMLLLQPIYGALVSHFPRRVFLPVVYGVFIACLGFFYWAFHYDFAWRSAVFFIWVAVFNLFAVSVFWSYMADVFRNADARRLYGYIGVGGTLGGFLGPIITRSLVNQVGVANLLLVSASLLTLCLLCIVKLAPFARAREIERNGHDDEQAMGGSILAGLRLIWQRPLLRAMAALMVFGVGVGTLLYNEQAAIARTAFDTAEARTSYYAMIDLAINLTTISVQMLLTRYLLVRFGIAPLLLIPAGLILLGYCLLAAAPLPMLVATVQVLTRSGEFSLAKPARETVYTRVDRESRYKAKAVIDTVVYRGGDVVFVWTHKLLASFGSLSVFLGGATLAAGLAFSAWQLVRLQRKPLPEESSVPGADLLTARHP